MIKISKNLAFPNDVKTVEIIAVGNARLIAPVNQVWDDFFANEKISDDFLEDREQPFPQEQDSF